MHKILISACLLGEKVRFDGKSKKINAEILEVWNAENRLIALCPEVAGGLSVPRSPAEIQGELVINILGEDVSRAFTQGAQKALELCQQHDIQIAILKEGSPSCGVSQINDGTFSHAKIAGQGVTVQLLQKHGVKVFSEHQLNEAQAYLQSIF
ncbi:MAG: DUF523 domain-containing protein, partial [Mariprofundaceae bacterium]|nr:DUF523 domain-containing protein [Mariprofundaceae bacterium]